MFRSLTLAIALTTVALTTSSQADDSLIAHWTLCSDARDASGSHHAMNHGVRFKENSAVFNGVGAWLEVPVSKQLELGNSDFSIAVWIRTDEQLDDVLGDVVACYDPD